MTFDQVRHTLEGVCRNAKRYNQSGSEIFEKARALHVSVGPQVHMENECGNSGTKAFFRLHNRALSAMHMLTSCRKAKSTSLLARLSKASRH